MPLEKRKLSERAPYKLLKALRLPPSALHGPGTSWRTSRGCLRITSPPSKGCYRLVRVVVRWAAFCWFSVELENRTTAKNVLIRWCDRSCIMLYMAGVPSDFEVAGNEEGWNVLLRSSDRPAEVRDRIVVFLCARSSMFYLLGVPHPSFFLFAGTFAISTSRPQVANFPSNVVSPLAYTHVLSSLTPPSPRPFPPITTTPS